MHVHRAACYNSIHSRGARFAGAKLPQQIDRGAEAESLDRAACDNSIHFRGARFASAKQMALSNCFNKCSKLSCLSNSIHSRGARSAGAKQSCLSNSIHSRGARSASAKQMALSNCLTNALRLHCKCAVQSCLSNSIHSQWCPLLAGTKQGLRAAALAASRLRRMLIAARPSGHRHALPVVAIGRCLSL